MQIETIPVGVNQTNCYLVGLGDGGDAILIDPGDEAERIMRVAGARDWQIKEILLTHGHWDHIGAAAEIKRATDASISIHPDDLFLYDNLSEQVIAFGMAGRNSVPADKMLNDGETLTICGAGLRVIHAPGHSPGSVLFLMDELCFAGDTIFAGSYGRVDLPGGSEKDIVRSLKEKIFKLSNETRLLCGHGSETTVAREKLINPIRHLC